MNVPTAPAAARLERAPALQLSGSTTLLASIQRAAEAYMRTHAARIVVNGGVGTARGYKALLDGATDVAMASGAAPDELAAGAAARGLSFRETVVARDAILALLHPSNPVEVLTLAELRAIYTGRIANWRALGGPDAAIEVLVGPPTGGVTSSWRASIVGDDATFTPRARVLGAGERAARLAAHPAAIGYLPAMALPARGLKIPRIARGAGDRTAPEPAQAPLMLVTLGAPSALAARFIAHAATRADLALGGWRE